MASLKNLLSFLSFTLFSLALAAPSAVADQPNLANINPDEEYVTVFDRDLHARSWGNNQCGDIDSLCAGIQTDVKNIIGSVNEVIAAIKEKQACGCAFDESVHDLLKNVHQLIQDLVADIFKIDWVCIKISLCFTLANCFISLINCLIQFVLCVLSYSIAVKIAIDAAIWQIILDIPAIFIKCIEKICGDVLVFKLIVWNILLNIKAVIHTLLPHCGCSSPF